MFQIYLDTSIYGVYANKQDERRDATLKLIDAIENNPEVKVYYSSVLEKEILAGTPRKGLALFKGWQEERKAKQLKDD